MAKNGVTGDGHRNGMVKHRSQMEHPNGYFFKRNTETGQFMDGYHEENHKFKGVRKEKKSS